MSKINNTLLLIGLCLFSVLQANSQNVNNFSSHRFLIVFEAGTSASEIQDARDDLNCKEIWVSPISEVRLWEVRSFPFIYPPTGLPISNINEESNTARSRARVQEAGLNYEGQEVYNITDQSIPGNQEPDYNMDCYGQLVTNTASQTSPVEIGVFDTGFNYPDFIDYPDYYFDIDNFIEYDYIDNDPIADDSHGHGTHVSSVIAHITIKDANEMNYNEPDISYNMCKTFDDQGFGYLAEIIYSFEEAVLNGMQIANFSWSFKSTRDDAYNSPLRHSLNEVLADYEVLIVAASGNNGEDIDNTNNWPNWPAAYEFEKILSVGSYDCSGDVASFSNYGDKSVDIVAPGYKIPGLTLDGLTMKTGTSQSTSIISGVAGTLATHQLVFDALEIKCAILKSAIASSNLQLKILSGGYIDANRALTILGNCELAAIRTNNGIQNEVYPNPTIDHVKASITVNAETITDVIIYNHVGQIVQKTQTVLNKGNNNIVIPLNFESTGMFIIKIETPDQDVKQSFIKI